MHSIEPWLDSVVPRTCAGCQRPGRSWCHNCSTSLRGYRASFHEPSMGGPALLAVIGEHRGLLRAAVLLHKARSHRGVRADLTALVSLAMSLAVATVRTLIAGSAPLLLVPVPPSSPSAWRSPAAEIAQSLAAASGDLHLAQLLRARRRRARQKTLDAAGRARNVAGAFQLRPQPLPQSRTVVLLDDVVTTGATLAAVADLLQRSGFRVPAAVALSHTPSGHAGP